MGRIMQGFVYLNFIHFYHPLQQVADNGISEDLASCQSTMKAKGMENEKYPSKLRSQASFV